MPSAPITKRPREITLGKKFPMIICLCGSTRFKPLFELQAALLANEGHIVLTPSVYHHADPNINPAGLDESHETITKEQEQLQNMLHQTKIQIADQIYVINFGGYIGSSTRDQINFAKQQNKPIIFLEAPTEAAVGDEYDQPGGSKTDTTQK